MKRELKVEMLMWRIPAYRDVTKPIPMKRELKVAPYGICYIGPVVRHKANPDEKGTESSRRP